VRVTFFSESDRGACHRYRVALPVQALNEQRGITARFSMQWNAGVANDDVYVFHRNHLKEAIQLLHRLTLEGRVAVYDIDDNVFHIPESNPVFNLYMNSPSIPWNQVISMRYASAISVSSSGLRQAYAPLNDKIRVIPNCISVSECVDVSPVFDTGKILVFWGGSPTHKQDLEILKYVVPAVRKRHGDKVEFVIMGEPDAEFPVPVLHVPFGSYGFFQRVMRSCHIGLAPMADNAFNRGKSDLRIKELASMRLPVVASPVGDYNIPDLNMMHCAEPRDWVEAISELIDSRARRRELSDASWEWVQQWDISNHVHLWVELIEELTNVRKRRDPGEVVKVQGGKRAQPSVGSDRVTVVKPTNTRDRYVRR